MWLVKTIIFTFFSVATAIATLLAYPVDLKHRLSDVILKTWTSGTLKLYGVKVNVYGKDNISGRKGRIYVSNHASYLDIFVLLAKVPDSLRMVYKKEMNRMPLISWAMMASGFVPIDRKNTRSALRSLDKTSDNLRKGLSYVIFPEGTRSSDGSVGPFKRGMFIITGKTDAEVVPVSLSNTNVLLPRDTINVKPGTVNLVIGKPVKPEDSREFVDDMRNTVIANMKPVEEQL